MLLLPRPKVFDIHRRRAPMLKDLLQNRRPILKGSEIKSIIENPLNWALNN